MCGMSKRMSKSRSVPISIRLPEDLLTDLDGWINGQRVPPNRAAVLAIALREFLDREAGKKRK